MAFLYQKGITRPVLVHIGWAYTQISTGLSAVEGRSNSLMLLASQELVAPHGEGL